MQHFRAEVSKLGRFAVGNFRNGARFAYQARISSEHAFDIGPDDDLIGIESGAKNRGGIIRAPTAQRGEHAVDGCTDKTSNDGYLAVVQQRADTRLRMLAGRLGLRICAAVERVGDDKLGGFDGAARDTHLRERSGEDRSAEPLSKTGDGVER